MKFENLDKLNEMELTRLHVAYCMARNLAGMYYTQEEINEICDETMQVEEELLRRGIVFKNKIAQGA